LTLAIAASTAARRLEGSSLAGIEPTAQASNATPASQRKIVLIRVVRIGMPESVRILNGLQYDCDERTSKRSLASRTSLGRVSLVSCRCVQQPLRLEHAVTATVEAGRRVCSKY